MENSFFSEWVIYENDEEKEFAKLYLDLWKKFYLRKINEFTQVGEDQFIDRKDVFGKGIHTLGIKIEAKPKNKDKIVFEI